LPTTYCSTHHHHHHLSSGAGTIGQIVANVSSGLIPPQETNLTLKLAYSNIKWNLLGVHLNFLTTKAT
jgi:proline racemase